MADEQLTYIGEQAAEMIASGVKQEIDKNVIHYNLDETGTGLNVSGGLEQSLDKISINEIYNTDEKIIGTYLGKPLYRKTFKTGVNLTFNPITKSGNRKTTNAVLMVEDINVINFYGNFKCSNADGWSIWWNFSSTAFSNTQVVQIFSSLYKDASNNIIIAISTLYDTALNMLPNAELTIEYTKATDSPSTSIARVLHEYSTEEKVIGTWIDGKPIYERVVDIGYMFSIAGNAWTVLPNFPENVKCIVRFVGIQYDGNVYNMWNLNASSGGDVFSYRSYALGINQYIIQYTKTTD